MEGHRPMKFSRLQDFPSQSGQQRDLCWGTQYGRVGTVHNVKNDAPQLQRRFGTLFGCE